MILWEPQISGVVMQGNYHFSHQDNRDQVGDSVGEKVVSIVEIGVDDEW